MHSLQLPSHLHIPLKHKLVFYIIWTQPCRLYKYFIYEVPNRGRYCTAYKGSCNFNDVSLGLNVSCLKHVRPCCLAASYNLSSRPHKLLFVQIPSAPFSPWKYMAPLGALLFLKELSSLVIHLHDYKISTLTRHVQ